MNLKGSSTFFKHKNKKPLTSNVTPSVMINKCMILKFLQQPLLNMLLDRSTILDKMEREG